MLAVLLGVAAQPPPIEQLFEALQAQPLSAGAHSNYGVALKREGDLRGAIERFEDALLLDPTYARAYNNWGNAQQALGDYEAAANNHRIATQLQPDLATAYSNLGNALRQLDEPQQAVQALGVAVQLNPSYGAAYTNLGAAVLSGGQPEAATKFLEVAISLAPAEPSAVSNLGAALEELGRLEEAAAVYTTGLREHGASPLAATMHINHGNVLRALGRVQESISKYGDALRTSTDGASDHTAYNNMAASLQAAGQAHRAMEAYEAALALRPDDATASSNMDKLPVSDAYRRAADFECKVMANRAARAALAARWAFRSHRDLVALGVAEPIAWSYDAPKGEDPPLLLSLALHRTVRYLRRLETERVAEDSAAALWNSRSRDMSATIGDQLQQGAAAFTLSNFAWGGVWYQTFAACFTHPQTRAALMGGGSVVVLGSSLGFEAYFASMTYGLRTVGVEILCGLVDLSDVVRKASLVPTTLNSFVCADALDYSLPSDAAVVYVDDTAWDRHAVEKLAGQLPATLRKGAIVIHNAAHGYEGARYRPLASLEIATSWNPRHVIHVHEVL